MKCRQHCVSKNLKSQYIRVYSLKMEPHVRCNFDPVADYDESRKNGAENSPNLQAGNFEICIYLVIHIKHIIIRYRYQ